MKKAFLIVSLILNIALVVALIGLWHYNRKVAFQLMADVTSAEVTLQAHLLSKLESGKESDIEEIKALFRHNIEIGKKSAANGQAVIKW